MIATCQHCGAPLDVKPSSATARCNYCDHVNPVRRMGTVLPQTPAGWQPPPAWAPPPQYHLGPQPLTYHKRSSNAAVVIVIVAGVMVATIGGIVAVLVSIVGHATTVTVNGGGTPNVPPIVTIASPQPGGGGVALTGGDRVLCAGGRKDLTNQRMETVIATNGCQMTLTNCTVTGSPGIIASQRAKVVMVGGSVGSGMVAVVASAGAEVVLRGVQVSGQIVEQDGATVTR